MRFFIALEIPDDSKNQIQLVQQKLATLIPEAKLTDPNKLHLTLAFLGEQPNSLQPYLIQIIQNAVLGVKPFEITPAYIDGFPNLHSPNILWMGVKGDIDKLLLIRERIKDNLVKLGIIIDERRYIPHIAVAKTTDFSVDEALEQKLEEITGIFFDEIKIESIKLFESIPNEDFHSHNTLAEIKL